MVGDEKEIVRRLMREIARGFLYRDVPALDRALADDFTYTDAAGVVGDKYRWLSDLATGELAFESIISDALDVKRVGDSIHVRGQLTLRARYTRSNYNGTFRYIGAYAQRDGEWRLVLSSARVVPQAELLAS